ncbi:MAG TPA: hypothetical protein VKV05_12755 [Terriglobales bacterium]|nr:hypothetical protein [Terriglobales bacterium]
MAPRPGQPSRWEIWRRRIFLAIVVLFWLEIGIILMVAPWTPFWDNNSLLVGFPSLREFFMHDFVRGVVSGLGLVDILLAIAEAVQYRESAG